jgi:hypothetical protein
MKPASIIFRGVPNKIIQRNLAAQVKRENLNVYVRCEKGGSMNQEAMLDYVADNFGLAESANSLEEGNGGVENTAKNMLIMDSHRAHITDKVKMLCKQNKLALAIIPGGYTPVLQPLDVGVNRSFKSKMRQKWTHWMWQAVKRDSNTPRNKAGKIKPPSRIQLCRWVHQCCSEVSTQVMANSFRKVFLG